MPKKSSRRIRKVQKSVSYLLYYLVVLDSWLIWIRKTAPLWSMKYPVIPRPSPYITRTEFNVNRVRQINKWFCVPMFTHKLPHFRSVCLSVACPLSSKAWMGGVWSGWWNGWMEQDTGRFACPRRIELEQQKQTDDLNVNAILMSSSGRGGGGSHPHSAYTHSCTHSHSVCPPFGAFEHDTHIILIERNYSVANVWFNIQHLHIITLVHLILRPLFSPFFVSMMSGWCG